MPVVPDHPIRRIRIGAGITQPQFARQAHVSRPLISAIEEGRIRHPAAAVVEAAAAVAHVSPQSIENALTTWWETPLQLTPIARNVIGLPPIYVSRYASFVNWRQDIAPSPTALASMLRIARAAVTDYEQGRQELMSSALTRALRDRLGVSQDYLDALAALPHGYAPSNRRRRPTPFDGLGRGANPVRLSANLAAATREAADGE